MPQWFGVAGWPKDPDRRVYALPRGSLCGRSRFFSSRLPVALLLPSLPNPGPVDADDSTDPVLCSGLGRYR
jgi:hypothetical protein